MLLSRLSHRFLTGLVPQLGIRRHTGIIHTCCAQSCQGASLSGYERQRNCLISELLRKGLPSATATYCLIESIPEKPLCELLSLSQLRRRADVEALSYHGIMERLVTCEQLKCDSDELDIAKK